MPPETELAVVAVDDTVSSLALITVTGGLVHVVPASEQRPLQNVRLRQASSAPLKLFLRMPRRTQLDVGGLAAGPHRLLRITPQ
jgi:hypothetical protein